MGNEDDEKVISAIKKFIGLSDKDKLFYYETTYREFLEQQKLADRLQSCMLIAEGLLKEEQEISQKEKKRADDLKKILKRDEVHCHSCKVMHQGDMYRLIERAEKSEAVASGLLDVSNSLAEKLNKSEAELKIEIELADRLREHEFELEEQLRESKKEFQLLSDWLQKAYHTDVDEIMKVLKQ